MNQPLELGAALLSSLRWAPAWPLWILAAGAMLASLRPRPDALPLHLLLAGAQSAAFAGAYSFHLGVSSLTCQSPANFPQLGVFLAFALQVPIVAVAPLVLARCRRSLPEIWPGPFLAAGAGCCCALIAIVGSALALGTPFGSRPTWADFAALFP